MRLFKIKTVRTIHKEMLIKAGSEKSAIAYVNKQYGPKSYEKRDTDFQVFVLSEEEYKEPESVND